MLLPLNPPNTSPLPFPGMLMVNVAEGARPFHTDVTPYGCSRDGMAAVPYTIKNHLIP
jgi:hypothetical protein